MALFDCEGQRVVFKIVYFGPSLAGKGTNLKSLRRMAPEKDCGRLMSLRSRRTTSLFFDLLTLRFQVPGHANIKVHSSQCRIKMCTAVLAV